MEEENTNLKLCFIRLVGEESGNEFRYEFIFTNDIDEVWGEEFSQKPACLVNNLIPEEKYMDEIHIVKTKIKLELIQNNCCFSISDCYDGVVAMAWECLDEYEDYPEDGRLFFYFGETIEEVKDKLAVKNILMDE